LKFRDCRYRDLRGKMLTKYIITDLNMNKPIICFEGPSGIGKSTMCDLLSDTYNIVPEVNLLFERTGRESKYWYHLQQVERYKMCMESDKTSFLDGDVFQPIWYNWVCNYPSAFLPKEETHQFYKKMLIEDEIAFPDLYIIFHIDEQELWVRKEGDKSRQRRNFKKHLKIIEPLKAYWRFLDQETDIEVKFIHYKNIDETKLEVLSFVENATSRKIDELKAFGHIEEWVYAY